MLTLLSNTNSYQALVMKLKLMLYESRSSKRDCLPMLPKLNEPPAPGRKDKPQTPPYPRLSTACNVALCLRPISLRRHSAGVATHYRTPSPPSFPSLLLCIYPNTTLSTTSPRFNRKYQTDTTEQEINVLDNGYLP